jgi:hypothetical protein
VEFECDVGTWTGNVPVQITGQAVDSAPTFAATTYDISSRTDTTATVPWTITEQYTVDSQYPSPDISSIIQEIIDRPGWNSGNSIVIMFTTSGTNTREMEAYDGETTAAPRLVIEYTIGGGGLTWHAHETKTITGTTDTTTFTTTLPDGDYRWNCLVYDDAGHSAFAPADNLFTITIPTVNYVLTTNTVGHGSITPASGSSYPAGTIVPVQAIPDIGYKFVSWSGALTGSTNPTTITMNSDNTITATFIETTPPTVTLDSPADDSTVTTSTIDFSCTSIDNINLHNVTLYTGQATPPTPGSISVRVSTGTDDAEEYITDGYTYYTSTDLELGYDDAHSPYSAQIVGTRFNNIQIPKGATITNAYVEFECDVGTWTGDVPLQITGQDIDSASTFTSSAYNISSRIDTTAIVPWTITAQWVVDSKYPSPDIRSVIQEIIDRPGWNSGNFLVIMFTASGTNRREMEAYEGGEAATAAPLLIVEYTTGGETTWTKQETKSISGTTSTTTFTVTLADGTYKWNCLAYDEAGNSAFAPSDFDLTVSPVPVFYTLTTHVVGNGVITPASGSIYLAGTVVNVEAIPDSSWQFDSWSGDLSGADNTTTITMNSDKTITATFTEIPPAPSGILEDFNTGFTLGQTVGAHADWYDGGGGPLVTSGVGVAGSVGLAPANNIFTWEAQPFNWNDPNFLGVDLQMDFESSAAGTFDDDRIGWMTTITTTSSTYIFGVQLDNPDGGIVTYWQNSGGSSIKSVITTYSGIAANSWYRLRVNITKLTATSAKIDVTLIQLDSSGNPVSIIASGSVTNTDTYGTNKPADRYFTATTIWPAFKNYNALSGEADNAYVKLLES